MKIQVRKSVFETNSSTCHTIAIPKRQIEKEEVTLFDIYPEYGKSYCFERGLLRFVGRVGERIAYSYMAILYKLYHEVCMKIKKSQRGNQNVLSDMVLEKVKIWKDRILEWIEEYAEDPEKDSHKKEIMDTVQKMLVFLEAQILDIPTDIDMFGKHAFIDHPEEIMGFVEAIKEDPELLKKFIFDPDSYATVCGDEYRGAYLKKAGFEDDYDCDEWDDKKRELEADYYMF